MSEVRLRNPDGTKQDKKRLKLKELNASTLKRLANLHMTKSRSRSSADIADRSMPFDAEPIMEVPEATLDSGERPGILYRRSNTYPGSGCGDEGTNDAATQTPVSLDDDPSQLMFCSKESLIEMLVITKAQLEEKDNEVCDLHDYVERLLVRIMKLDASLLQHPTSVERVGSHAA